MKIAPLLEVRPGITALVGGGGKTTLMTTLAAELREEGTVIVTTSTHIRCPEGMALLMRATEEEIVCALKSAGVVCVAEQGPEGKLAAPELEFSLLAQLADYVLVEADGSRGLPLKAHAPHEPVIPRGAHVIQVVGADGLGKPMAKVCHRPERYAALCGTSTEEVVSPKLAAKVLLAEDLGHRVYINKVESPRDRENAAALAAELTCPVVAGSLHGRRYTCLY